MIRPLDNTHLCICKPRLLSGHLLLPTPKAYSLSLGPGAYKIMKDYYILDNKRECKCITLAFNHARTT